MRKGINGWCFERTMPLVEAARAAREAGFEVFEPTLEADGPLAVTTPQREIHDLGEAIRAAGLEIHALACGLTMRWPFTSPDPAIRQRAAEIVLAGLDRARWLGADVLLVVPGRLDDPADPRRPVVGYEDALWYASELLTELSHEAETRGVTVGLENTWGRFLISPVEMREFIDRIGSPWVGVYLDVGNVLAYGYPQDWIRTLAGRLCGLHAKDFKLSIGTKAGFCLPGEGDVDWPEVLAALKQVGYKGPLTCEGKGTPEQLAGSLDRILAAEKVG